MTVSPRSAPYDAVLLDLDGCLWVGDEATPGRARGGRRAARGRARHRLPHQRRAAVRGGARAKAVAARLPGVAREVVTRRRRGAAPAGAERDGGSRVRRRLPGARRPRRGRGPADRQRHLVRRPARTSSSWRGTTTCTYDELRVATQAVLRGAELIGAARDRTFPMRRRPWPGTGAILRGDRVRGRPAGRPHRRQAGARHVRTALDRLGNPARVLAVGDRADADVAGARADGLDGALVLTGGDHAPQATPRAAATHVAATLAELVLGAQLAVSPRDAARRLPDRQPACGRRPRAAKRLPAVEAALRAHGPRFHVERTTSMEHARELARAARAAPASSPRRWAATASRAPSPASCTARTPSWA